MEMPKLPKVLSIIKSHERNDRIKNVEINKDLL